LCCLCGGVVDELCLLAKILQCICTETDRKKPHARA
jgi:hypothetical protein